MQLIGSDGAQLVCDGRPYRFVLVNAYYLQDEVGQGSSQNAADALDACVALGVPVVRTWGFNDDANKQSRMRDDLDRPREEGLRALDWVLDEAARRGLRLILPLVNYWTAYGGIAQWLRWRGLSVAGGTAGDPGPQAAARFYADPQLREAYRAWAGTLLTRKNTRNGRVYGEDPTVLAWELMNEPRGAPDDWIAFAAAAVRAHARQLVGLGDEAARASVDVDLASLHFYPQKHGGAGDELRFGHAAITDALRRADRPLVVGEFGLTNDLPVELRRRCYDEWFDWAASEGVAGMGPWLLGHRGRDPKDDENFTFFRGGDYDEVIRVAGSKFSR